MILTKNDITSYIKEGKINFSPTLDAFQLQPHSVDLRLGFKFGVPKNWELTGEGRKAINIDPLVENSANFDSIELTKGQFFEILPKEYIVASTLEKIELISLDIMCILYPRSSINRRGLAVDLSGIIDAGYKGNLMIPIKNNTQDQVIRIYPGERICTITFQKLTSEISLDDALTHGLNKAKYHEANGFVESKTDKAEEIKLIREGEINLLKTKFALK